MSIYNRLRNALNQNQRSREGLSMTVPIKNTVSTIFIGAHPITQVLYGKQDYVSGTLIDNHLSKLYRI